MKKYEGISVREGKTFTGKLPDNVGFPGKMEGTIRKLTAKERKAQRDLAKG